MRNRLQQLLLPSVQLGMQVCWLYAWSYVIEMKVFGHLSVTPAIILFAFLGLVVQAGVDRLPLKSVFRVVCFWIAWWLLSALLGKLLLSPETPWLFALPRALIRLIFETRVAELLLLFGSACAWYLGGRAAGRQATYESLLAQFQFGLVLLLGAFLLAHGLEIATGHPVLLSLLFFALSLSGIALMRNRLERERTSLPANRHFTGSLISLIAIVFVLGLLASIAITPDLVAVLLDAGRFVLHAIEAVFVFIFSLLPSPDMPSGGEMEPPASGEDSGVMEFYKTFPWPAILRRIMFILWVVVVCGMLLFALWRMCTMVLDWLRRRGSVAGIEIESLDSGLLADLLAMLLWLERKTKYVAALVARFVNTRLGTVGQPTWGSVYAGLMHWARKKVAPREPSQSVHEYQSVLSAFLPSAVPDLSFVTEVYARARYGGREPDATTVSEMQRAVQRIRKSPRRRDADRTNTRIEGAQ